MKSIGTITFHNTINYGANLQTYALQRVLTEMGYQSEIIDYSPTSELGISVLSPLKRLRHYVWQVIVAGIPAAQVRKKRTDEFRRKHFKLSGLKYQTADDLHKFPPQYDSYITGSDQVWNPETNNSDSSWFLTFVPSGKRKISYAASFGVSLIQEKFVENTKNWLSAIDCLSTRELEGRQIIKDLTGRDAEVTLDPTLLLNQDQWRQVSVPFNSSSPYVLCYHMPGDKVVNTGITQIAQQVSRMTGWKIICIGQKEYMVLNPLKHSIFNAGPAEFLGLFQNAAFIVTNSFHGTAFAINFQKPFYVPINQSLPPEKALTSRITTLLKTLRLEDRLVPAGQTLSRDKDLEMDFQPALKLLKKEIQSSINFLKKSLEGI